MTFEQIKISEKLHSNDEKINISNVHLPSSFLQYFVEIRYTTISILQERTLTLD